MPGVDLALLTKRATITARSKRIASGSKDRPKKLKRSLYQSGSVS